MDMIDFYKQFYCWRRNINEINFFDNTSPLLEKLSIEREKYTKKIKSGKKLFRGRIFDYDDVVDYGRDGDQLTSKVFEYRDNYKPYELNLYEGYPRDLCGAPPRSKAIEGRLNCSGIPYLYTCDTVKTVMYELRPIKDATISVAQLTVNKDLMFADFSLSSIEKLKEYSQESYRLYYSIAEEFSRPHCPGHSYKFTQYLAGQMMNFGFDGVIFNSSLLDIGKNYVIFNPDNCDIKNSKLYSIKKISISFCQTSRMKEMEKVFD